MLNQEWTWDAFRKRTDIRFRSRGNNMKGVDDALKEIGRAHV